MRSQRTRIHNVCSTHTSTRARVQAHQSKRTRARVHAQRIGVRRPYHRLLWFPQWQRSHAVSFPGFSASPAGSPSSLFSHSPRASLAQRAHVHTLLAPRARSIGFLSPVCPGYAVHRGTIAAAQRYSVAFVLVGGSFWADFVQRWRLLEGTPPTLAFRNGTASPTAGSAGRTRSGSGGCPSR